MPGTRQPLALLEAKGKKHLSRAERAQRQAEEVRLPKPAKIPPPAWLPEELKKQFRSLTKQLIEADMGVAQLDQDGLAKADRTAGRLVTQDTEVLDRVRRGEARAVIRQYLDAMAALGYSVPEAAAILQEEEST